MTDQQYIELGKEVEAFVKEWEKPYPGDYEYQTERELFAFAQAIIGMVQDRQPEPDDGP